MLVSRDAKLMEDVFDGGRCTQGEEEDVVNIQEDDSLGHKFLSYQLILKMKTLRETKTWVKN